jgi:hypothetical protein
MIVMCVYVEFVCKSGSYRGEQVQYNVMYPQHGMSSILFAWQCWTIQLHPQC